MLGESYYSIESQDVARNVCLNQKNIEPNFLSQTASLKLIEWLEVSSIRNLEIFSVDVTIKILMRIRIIEVDELNAYGIALRSFITICMKAIYNTVRNFEKDKQQ